MMLILQPILAVLRAIPWWAYAIAACLAWGGVQRFRANHAAATYQQAQAEAAAEREAALQAAMTETARRLDAQARATKDADEKLLRARGAAASAGAASDKLRQQLAAIQASASAGNPSAPSASQAGRLAELFGECVERYRAVAVAADRSVIAGLACEASYKALTP